MISASLSEFRHDNYQLRNSALATIAFIDLARAGSEILQDITLVRTYLPAIVFILYTTDREYQKLKDEVPVEKIKVGQSVDDYVSPKVLDPSLALKVPGSAGTMILFTCFTPHSSAPNLSSYSRRAMILTYNPAQAGSGYEATSGAHLKKIQAWLSERK